MSIWHWLVVLGVGLLLFGGRGKLTSVMGDFAKGIKAFKSGMKEEEEPAATTPQAQVIPPGGVATPSPTAAAGAHSTTATVEPKREHA